jgi:adenosylcobinamide-phosphate guanylyltransferase
MIAIILAGGKGSRLASRGEKPLLKVKGERLIDRVAGAITESGVSGLLVAVSPHAPGTEEHCRRAGYPVIQTPGRGYHEDIGFLIRTHPRFVSVASDIPFLTSAAVDEIEGAFRGCSITGAIPISIFPAGFRPAHVFRHSRRRLVAVGLNVATRSPGSKVLVLDDPLLGVNVNTPDDLMAAEAILPAGKENEERGAKP